MSFGGSGGGDHGRRPPPRLIGALRAERRGPGRSEHSEPQRISGFIIGLFLYYVNIFPIAHGCDIGPSRVARRSPSASEAGFGHAK
jgi:hypothetical protein